jgi:hypothetical protein
MATHIIPRTSICHLRDNLPARLHAGKENEREGERADREQVRNRRNTILPPLASTHLVRLVPAIPSFSIPPQRADLGRRRRTPATDIANTGAANHPFY